MILLLALLIGVVAGLRACWRRRPSVGQPIWARSTCQALGWRSSATIGHHGSSALPPLPKW